MRADSERQNRVTTCAQHVLDQVVPRAVDRGILAMTRHTVLAMALWSTLRWERKVGIVALEACHVDLDALASDMDELLYNEAECLSGLRGPMASGTQLGVALDWLVQQAAVESANIGHSWIGTEHLLMAVACHAEGALRGVLDEHGIEHAVLATAVLSVLNRTAAG